MNFPMAVLAKTDALSQLQFDAPGRNASAASLGPNGEFLGGLIDMVSRKAACVSLVTESAAVLTKLIHQSFDLLLIAGRISRYSRLMFGSELRIFGITTTAITSLVFASFFRIRGASCALVLPIVFAGSNCISEWHAESYRQTQV
jgi:hypothetical protein